LINWSEPDTDDHPAAQNATKHKASPDQALTRQLECSVTTDLSFGEESAKIQRESEETHENPQVFVGS